MNFKQGFPNNYIFLFLNFLAILGFIEFYKTMMIFLVIQNI